MLHSQPRIWRKIQKIGGDISPASLAFRKYGNTRVTPEASWTWTVYIIKIITININILKIIIISSMMMMISGGFSYGGFSYSYILRSYFGWTWWRWWGKLRRWRRWRGWRRRWRRCYLLIKDKVRIAKELKGVMAGDVSPVAMFYPMYFSKLYFSEFY